MHKSIFWKFRKKPSWAIQKVIQRFLFLEYYTLTVWQKLVCVITFLTEAWYKRQTSHHLLLQCKNPYFESFAKDHLGSTKLYNIFYFKGIDGLTVWNFTKTSLCNNFLLSHWYKRQTLHIFVTLKCINSIHWKWRKNHFGSKKLYNIFYFKGNYKLTVWHQLILCNNSFWLNHDTNAKTSHKC